MKKHSCLTFFGIFFIFLSVLLLTGCGNKSSGAPAVPNAEEPEADSFEPFSHAKPQTAPSDADYVFPDAAPFIDDTGRSMQRDGDDLYIYYDGRLMCFDKETEETILLYQTASTHRLNFCLSEDFIYFVERKGYDSLDDRDTALYRIGKDGSDLTLLQDDIINASSVREWDQYQIDLYDNIIYLINYISEYEDGNYVTKTANLYYKLEQNGSVSEISEIDTLYSTLPQHFSPVCNSDIPSLPYAMRNYGYVFIQDSQKKLYRMDPVSGAKESLDIDLDKFSFFTFSGDMVLLYSYGSGPSLFGLSDQTMIETDASLWENTLGLTCFPTDQGFICFAKLSEETSVPDEYIGKLVIRHILPDGSVKTLFSETLQSLADDFSDSGMKHDSYFCDNYFYYIGKQEMLHHLMRFPIQKNPDFQILDTWSAFPAASSPSMITVEEQNHETEIGDFSSVSCSTSLLYLEEETDADRLINQALTEVYADFEDNVTGIIQGEQEQSETDPEYYEGFDYAPHSDFSLYASCDYMDDDTISFCCSYYQYFAGAAHGFCWSDYYVFDRKTGKRLSFEDFAGDSASILEIAFPYVEKMAEWDFDKEILEETLKEMLLEQSRFSLSEDGYTLYFAPYDIASYAAGDFLITIPYEAFEKKL